MAMFEKLTQSVFTKCLNELKRKENMAKVETELIDPLIQYAFKRLYPYVWMIGSCLLLLFVLLIITLVVFIRTMFMKGNPWMATTFGVVST